MTALNERMNRPIAQAKFLGILLPASLAALAFPVAPIALGAPGGPVAPGAHRPLQDSTRQDSVEVELQELERLIAAERREADLMRRRGDPRGAVRLLDDLLEDEPGDAESRTLRALAQFERGKDERALKDARRAFEDAREGGDIELAAQCLRNLAHMLCTLGETGESVELLDGADDLIDPERVVVDAWAMGRALDASGARTAARAVFEHALHAPAPTTWEGLLAKGRCEHALGRLERASRTLVEADKAARAAGGSEPDVLVALADLYFESEKEVEAKGKRSAGRLYREALELHPTHEACLLGLFRLHRYNRRRSSQTPEEILAQLLDANPRSVDGVIASASAALEDGQLRQTRSDLALLEELAPNRREKRSVEAALAWVEHRREDCDAILGELTRSAAEDGRPEREVGRHLVELYRFAEAEGFLQRAVERDPTDYLAWTYLGRSLANVGREVQAREAFEKADIAAAGRQDAWRNNMALVLRRMDDTMVEEDYGELTFSWQPDAAEVLRTYLVPFYQEARAELAERYGHTPSPTRIEVFRQHEDFSVRSVGFQGFPALGVCFGPVVTALSPLSEMRGNFSWARTSFHEFSHVIHLGLSHNRCPRWITEGLATWEEVNKSPMWTRNMRRELIDARANGDIIPVRELNRAFRGPRIIFGYYQGGLLCRMLIRDHGFRPMIRILEAFDRGLDVDEALDEVFGMSPEEVDEAFLVFVDEFLGSLEVEPRWSKRVVSRLRVTLPTDPPDEGLDEWADGWATIAWGSWQMRLAVDAEEALRLIDRAGLRPVRATFLRGEMALTKNNRRKARRHWEEAVEAGGRDYRALVALGALQAEQGDEDLAEATYLMAEEAFPGFDDRSLSAELRLAKLYAKRDETDLAMQARERWLRWNAGDLDKRREVAAWHFENGRFAEANRLFAEANEVDLFLRDLHWAWARSLQAEGRFEEALREYRVAALVPPELDSDHQSSAMSVEEALEKIQERGSVKPEHDAVALTDEERAQLLSSSAECLLELERRDEAVSAASQARALDADVEVPPGLLE